jgi:hypothetical protein
VLNDQIKRFKRPDYQPEPSSIIINASKPDGSTFYNIKFESQLRILEKYGDRTELWCRDIDRRFEYDLTQDEIIKLVREKEASGEDFTIMAGHGTAFYMSPATLEKVLAAAPEHLQGFLFSEMSNIEPEMQEVVLKLVLPLAEKCAAAGKKITFLNKMIFWSGSVYYDFWKTVLLNPKFSNVFIPSLEESNSRTQELSLAGRVGLWQTGSFSHWSSRVIRDNTNFDRMWEYSSRNITSHHLRQLVLNASMGADNFTINVSEDNQLIPFYEMLEKGIIAIPEQEELLSVSDLCLGMKSPPSPEYLNHGLNSSLYNFDEVTRSPMVFDRLDVYWAGAPTLAHDFSSYGYGCERRMHNFLPKYPYGLVAIVPDETDLVKFPRFKDKVTTDGQFFYDSEGRQHDAVDYKQTMLEKLKQSAERLPVLVKGDVAWSVVRLDPHHVRVTLVDPGYLNPGDRNAEIVLQHIKGIECTDILSREKPEIKEQKIKVRVPAGIFTIIDIKH